MKILSLWSRVLAIEAMGWFSSDGEVTLAQIRGAALHKLKVLRTLQ